MWGYSRGRGFHLMCRGTGTPESMVESDLVELNFPTHHDAGALLQRGTIWDRFLESEWEEPSAKCVGGDVVGWRIR